MVVFTGTTHADNERHVVARAAFMTALCELPRVKETLTWSLQGLVGTEVEATARAGDALARARGLSSRDLLVLGAGRANSRRTAGKAGNNEAALAQGYLEALDALQTALEQNIDLISAWAVTLVRDELRIPWPWVAIELGQALQMVAYREALGVSVTLALSYAPPRRPVRLTYASRAHEDPVQAVERLRRQVRRTMKQFEKVDPLPRGRALRDGGRPVARGARWWVQHHLAGMSKRQLAQTYRAERMAAQIHISADARKVVQDGLREAGRVLSLDRRASW